MFVLKPLVCVALLAYVELASAKKIYNGREVDAGEYPWTGWILQGTRKVKCGAVLIAKKYALTAASCAGDGDFTTVTFGDHSRATDEGTEQVATVASITIHPDYNSETFESDMAVVEFTEELNTGRRSAVATIPMLPVDKLTERVLTKHCRGAGWGFEVEGTTEKARDQSDVLLEIVIDVNRTCTNVPTGSVCYSPFRDSSSLTCAGDVGGPFMCKKRGEWTLVGVISNWNVDLGCTPGNRAATQVTEALSWIESIINIDTQSIDI